MKIHKLSSTDAFIAFDLDEEPAVGITRLARKVLVDGAQLLARSTTYAFASFEIRMGGGSAGINAEGDGRDPAVASFVEEVADLVRDGRWATDPGLGLTEADLGPLRIDDRHRAAVVGPEAARLTAAGAVAAAEAARTEGLAGARAALAGTGPVVDAATQALSEAGATVVEGGADAEADVVFVAGKSGVLDHDVAETVMAGIVVPLTPVPVTARAHAVLTRAGRVHVPDFLSTAAPLLAAHAADGVDPIEAVRTKVSSFAPEGAGMWMAAALAAEAFLASWRDELPFGRPLA